MMAMNRALILSCGAAAHLLGLVAGQCTDAGTYTAYTDASLVYRFTPAGISLNGGAHGERTLTWTPENAGAVAGSDTAFTMDRITDPLANYIL